MVLLDLIGGNAEAAGRAGISIAAIRTLAFTLCGLTAGMTGIIYASYLGSISNGLELLGLSAAAQLMWTALVLLAAVIVDRITRRGSAG